MQPSAEQQHSPGVQLSSKAQLSAAETPQRKVKRQKLQQVKTESDTPDTEAPARSSAAEELSVSAVTKAKTLDPPFPCLLRPTQEECRAARDGLARLHGEPKKAQLGEPKVPAMVEQAHHAQKDVLDSLVRTILSQNTTDVISSRAFASLKASFPTWESVRTAPPARVAESIRSGGLADIKTARVQDILNTVWSERGETSMEYLRDMSDAAIKEELSRFKGVGKKTIACLLMFCLDRYEFPVDTHVWRVSKQLGWVPKTATRDQAYAHLNERVPNDIKYDLHVLLVEHGKRCTRCAKNGQPRKLLPGDCPLVAVAASKRAACDV